MGATATRARDETLLSKMLMMLVSVLLAGYDAAYSFVEKYAPEYAEAAPEPKAADELAIMQQIRMIGGAVILIAIVVLVVNEVLTVNAINNSSGPFSGVLDSLNTTGVAAMSLLVVGLVVAAARAIMGFMGGGGF
jgi:hypothetical protein